MQGEETGRAGEGHDMICYQGGGALFLCFCLHVGCSQLLGREGRNEAGTAFRLDNALCRKMVGTLESVRRKTERRTGGCRARIPAS